MQTDSIFLTSKNQKLNKLIVSHPFEDTNSGQSAGDIIHAYNYILFQINKPNMQYRYNTVWPLLKKCINIACAEQLFGYSFINEFYPDLKSKVPVRVCNPDVAALILWAPSR